MTRVWTAELLREMERTGDALADSMLQEAAWQGSIPEISACFRSFAADDKEIPPGAPQVFLDFVARTRELPPGFDAERAARGARVMLTHATLTALALLLKSLPYGYASPRLSRVLHMTHNLEKRTYLRCLGVLQMMVNITREDAFRPGGAAVVTGQKLRLLHGGIRRVVAERMPEYVRDFGPAVSQLDMVFTIQSFSLQVLDGLRTLGVQLTADEAGDYFYLWQMYGELQGVERRWMPKSIEEGRGFCAAYEQWFLPARDNPPGVQLAQADLRMLKRLIPWWLRIFGLGVAPRLYALELLGEEAAARVGIQPVWGHWLIRRIVLELPAWWQRLWDSALQPQAHTKVSRWFLTTLISEAWHGEPRFSVPENLQDFRQLATPLKPPGLALPDTESQQSLQP